VDNRLDKAYDTATGIGVEDDGSQTSTEADEIVQVGELREAAVLT